MNGGSALFLQPSLNHCCGGHCRARKCEKENFTSTLVMYSEERSNSLRLRLSAPHLPALDGIRGVAAFSVVFFHFGIAWSPAGLGVLSFFVLSGFLITWLLLKEYDRSGSISLRNFYARRSLRIFPAFYAYWTICIALLLWRHPGQILWPQAWSAFFYVNNYYQALNGHISSVFSHTWSLAIEEQFYLLWPAALILLLRRTRQPVFWLSVAIGFISLHRLALQFLLHVHEVYIYEAFETRADSLLVGCLLAILLRRGYLIGFWRVICAHSALPLITLSALVVSLILGSRYGVAYRNVIAFFLEPILVALLIVQLISVSDAGPWSFINGRVMRFLGRISYSLYLYQQLLLYPAKAALHSLPTILQLIGGSCVVIAGAVFSYYMIERPFLRLKHLFSAPSIKLGVDETATALTRDTVSVQFL